MNQEQFEAEINALIVAGLKSLKTAISENEGELDEKSFRSLEILNKCITEVGKRSGGDKPKYDFTKVSDEDLESEF